MALLLRALLVGAVTLLACEQHSSSPTPDPRIAPTTEPTAGASALPGEDQGAVAEAASQATRGESGPSGTSTTSAAASARAPAPVASARASASAAEQAPVLGATKTEPEYSVWLEAGRAVAGKAATARAVLVAKGEWKCNESYPFKLKLDAAPEGVSYPSPMATGAAVTKERATLGVPFTAATVGAKTIGGTFHFSICNAEKCLMKKQKLSVTVTVAES